MVKGMGRRDFLGRTIVATAASGVFIRSMRGDEAPSRKVVVGIMGLQRGAALARGFASLPGIEIKYVCDVDQTRATACAKALEELGKRTQPIGDFREILDDRAVDALVCAAPNHWHAPATILACSAGKHVYVEKPCSHNPQEGEWMIQAARKYNRAVQVGTQRRSSPTVAEAVALVRSGELGRAYCARSWYSASRGLIGRGKPAPVPEHLDYELWQGAAPRQPYVDNRVHYNWHWFWHWGNGELGNNGVHALDVCRWGLAVDYPTRVTSVGGRYCFDDDQETPDTHLVAFEFTDKKQISWQGHSCNRHESRFVTFYAEKGTVEIDDSGGYRVFDAAAKPLKQVPGGRGDGEHIANFVTAIRDDAPLALNAEIEEGHKSTLLCHLGNIAHRAGRTLHCDATSGRILDDEGAMNYWSRQYEPGWEPLSQIAQ